MRRESPRLSAPKPPANPCGKQGCLKPSRKGGVLPLHVCVEAGSGMGGVGVRGTRDQGTALDAPPSSKPPSGPSEFLSQIEVPHQPTSPTLSPNQYMYPRPKGQPRSNFLAESGQSLALWAGIYTHIISDPQNTGQRRVEEQGSRQGPGAGTGPLVPLTFPWREF